MLDSLRMEHQLEVSNRKYSLNNISFQLDVLNSAKSNIMDREEEYSVTV